MIPQWLCQAGEALKGAGESESRVEDKARVIMFMLCIKGTLRSSHEERHEWSVDKRLDTT